MAQTLKTLPTHMCEPILDIVKHSVDDIDTLLLKLQDRLKKTFVVGDEVNFKADSKLIRGVITAVHEQSTPIKINLSGHESDSPSSDKENGFASPSSSRTDSLKYSVKVNDKTVCSIPPSALARRSKLPSKEAIRKFVLSKATFTSGTSGSAGRWNVKSMAKKRKLLSPTESSKKTKTSKGKTVQMNTLDAFVKITRHAQEDNSNKTPTKPQGPFINLERTPSTKKNKTPSKSSAQKADSASPTAIRKAVVDITDCAVEPETFEPKNVAKKRTPSKDKTAIKQSSTSTSSKKQKILNRSSVRKDCELSSAAEVVVVDLSLSEKSANQESNNSSDSQSIKGKTGTVTVQRTILDSKSNPVVLKEKSHIVENANVTDTSKKPVSILKPGSVVLKQLTLFDLAKVSSSSAADSFATVTPPTPKIVRKYKQAVRDKHARTQTRYILLAARQLSDHQRSLLPDSMRSLVQEKIDSLKMRNIIKTVREDEKKMLQEGAGKKDDLLLTNSQSLPAGEPIALPEDISSSSVQDIIFVNQFLTAFKSYLSKPNHVKYDQLSFVTLASHLSSGDDVTLEIMISLLHTLLNDFTLSEAQEMGMLLKDIPINNNTLFRLLHLTFKLTSEKKGRSDTEKAELEEMAAAVQTYTREDMPPMIRLQCVKSLCTLLLDGQGIVAHQEDLGKKVVVCWKNKLKNMKAYTDFATKHGIEPPVDVNSADVNAADVNAADVNAVDVNAADVNAADVNAADVNAADVNAADVNAADGSGRSTPILVKEVGDQPQSLADALRLRREMSKKSAEEREKRQEDLKKQQEFEYQKQVLHDAHQAAVRAFSVSKRLSPLGVDRHYNRYWHLPKQQGLYVESGWVNDVPVSPGELPTLPDAEPFVKPDPQPYGWTHYADEAAIDALMKSLNQQGVREKRLWLVLLKHYKSIVAPSKTKEVGERESEKLRPLLESFREELEDLENRIRLAGLGGIDDYEKWSESLEAATAVDELGKYLIACQTSVYKNRRSGVMAGDNTAAGEKVANRYITRWQEAVGNAQTISTLFTLLEILDMCIAWEKSIDNTNCRVCKRKGDESTLLLCDGCDLGFHMGCLRLGLEDVPEGDWFCPSCTPKEERKGRTQRSLKDFSDSDGRESEEEEEESSDVEEEECVLCEQRGEVALCDTCFLGYHITCHQPPLRAMPRFAWTCHACRFGTKMKKKGKATESSADTVSESSDSRVCAKGGSRQLKEVRDSPPKKKEAKTQFASTKRGKTRKVVSEDSESDSEVKTIPSSSRATRDSRRQAREAKEVDSSISTPVQETRSARNAKRNLKSQSNLVSESESDTEREAPPAKMAAKKSVRSTRAERAGRDNFFVERATVETSKDKSKTSQKKRKASKKTEDEANGSVQKGKQEVETSSKLRNNRSSKQKEKPQLTLHDCQQQSKESKELSPHQLEQKLKVIHSKLWAHKSSWPFEYPIDPDEVPDYYNVVSTPMDLTKISEKMESYQAAEHFVEDVRQMIFNSFDYNKKGSEIAKLAVTFEDYFVSMLNRHLPAAKYSKQQSLFGL